MNVQSRPQLAIECSGAYGLTASPNGFISHPSAREVIFAGDAAGHLRATDVSEVHGNLPVNMQDSSHART